MSRDLFLFDKQIILLQFPIFLGPISPQMKVAFIVIIITQL